MIKLSLICCCFCILFSQKKQMSHMSSIGLKKWHYNNNKNLFIEFFHRDSLSISFKDDNPLQIIDVRSSGDSSQSFIMFGLVYHNTSFARNRSQYRFEIDENNYRKLFVPYTLISQEINSDHFYMLHLNKNETLLISSKHPFNKTTEIIIKQIGTKKRFAILEGKYNLK